MKYYQVLCKCGHVGRHKCIEATMYVQADSASEAAKKARNIPRVKHNHEDCILEMPLEITYDEYLAGRQENRKDPYLTARNIQEQRLHPEIYDRAVEDMHNADPDDEEPQYSRVYGIRNYKKFVKMHSWYEDDEWHTDAIA